MTVVQSALCLCQYINIIFYTVKTRWWTSPKKGSEILATIVTENWEVKGHHLLELFQIPTLEDRLIYLDLCTMFKIVHNLCYFPSDVLCELHVIRTTRATLGRPSHLHFHYPSFHTTQFQKSFVMLSIKAWNSLPLNLLSCPSLSSFKFHVWNCNMRPDLGKPSVWDFFRKLSLMHGW